MWWLLLLLPALGGGATPGDVPPPPDPEPPGPPRPGGFEGELMPCTVPPCPRDTEPTTRPGETPQGQAPPPFVVVDESATFGYLHNVSTRLDCPSAAEVLLGIDWSCSTETVGEVERTTRLIQVTDLRSLGNVAVEVIANMRLPDGSLCAVWTWELALSNSGWTGDGVLTMAEGMPDTCMDRVIRPWRPEWTPKLIVQLQGTAVTVMLRTYMGRSRAAYYVEGLVRVRAEWPRG